jgi:hypothetical protein
MKSWPWMSQCMSPWNLETTLSWHQINVVILVSQNQTELDFCYCNFAAWNKFRWYDCKYCNFKCHVKTSLDIVSFSVSTYWWFFFLFCYISLWLTKHNETRLMLSVCGWACPRVSLNCIKNRKVSCSCWESNPSHLAHSLFLHQLSYQGSI